MAKVKVRRGLVQELKCTKLEWIWRWWEMGGSKRHHILFEGMKIEYLWLCGQSQEGVTSHRTLVPVSHLSLSPGVRKHLKGISYWSFARIRYFLIFSYVLCFMGNVRYHDLQPSQQGVSSPWTPMNSLDFQHCGPAVQCGGGSLEVWQSCGPVCS